MIGQVDTQVNREGGFTRRAFIATLSPVVLAAVAIPASLRALKNNGAQELPPGHAELSYIKHDFGHRLSDFTRAARKLEQLTEGGVANAERQLETSVLPLDGKLRQLEGEIERLNSWLAGNGGDTTVLPAQFRINPLPPTASLEDRVQLLVIAAKELGKTGLDVADSSQGLVPQAAQMRELVNNTEVCRTILDSCLALVRPTAAPTLASARQ